MYHSPAIINPRNMEVVLQCFLLSKLIKKLRFQNKLKMQTIIQNLKSSLKKNYFRDIFLILLYFLNIFPDSSSVLVLALFSRSRHPPLALLVYSVLPIKPWESLGWQADMYYVCMSNSHRMTALECLNDKSYNRSLCGKWIAGLPSLW